MSIIYDEFCANCKKPMTHYVCPKCHCSWTIRIRKKNVLTKLIHFFMRPIKKFLYKVKVGT